MPDECSSPNFRIANGNVKQRPEKLCYDTSMMKLLIAGILFFATSSFASGPCTRMFRVSTNDYAPLYYLNENKLPAGYSHDLVEEIKKRMGCNFVEESFPAPRAISDFSNYRTDMTGVVPHSEALDQWGIYVPLYSTARILVIRKSKYDAKKTIRQLVETKKTTFAIQIGGGFIYHPEELQILKKENRVLDVPNPPSSYKLISEGRVDAFFSSPVINHYHMQMAKNPSELVTIRDPDKKLEVGIYLSKKKLSKTERDRLTQAIEDMKKDGTLKKLLLPYIDKEDVPYYRDL